VLSRRQALLLGAASACIGLDRASARAREPWRVGKRLYTDDFRHGLGRWLVEAEEPARVEAANGVLELDTPEGLSAWFRPELTGPVMIEYQAQAVSVGGPNDRISDLNAFWMATDPRSPGDLVARPRSGAFADYDQLQTYYVGQGGNANTTTRFRRYVGRDGDRPLLPENDRKGAEDLLVPNAWQTVRLIAFGGLIQYWRDGRKVFEYRDGAPYTRGWFALRTTRSHLRIRDFKVFALKAR
jgi:hypothetical protein